MSLFRNFRLPLLALFTAALALSGCGGALDATIGGTVYGLSGGTSVVLLDNGGDPVTVSANGSFTFSKTVQAPNSYDVTVETQPLGETCTVTNGTGSVSQNGGNVTSVAVTCSVTTTSADYLYVKVTGMNSGQSVVLSDGSGSPLTVYQAQNSGQSWPFPTALASGTSYDVTVTTQPTGQTCTVTNGSGTFSSSTVVVAVTCQ